MNKLFESIRKQWNKLFRRYDIVAEQKRLGGTKWTRHHIYQRGAFGKCAYLGYRLNVVDAIQVIAEHSNGDCHINIAKVKK
ncbi:hypothetical protein RCIP0073_00070 [Klebsiella phage RCIP0073]|nr:hypothetical protein K62PH164C2_LOCUS71 [Klebsiella phage vB_Kpn_K62PH164C2]